MKILFVTGALGGGGAERVIVNLINNFENKGIRTTSLTVFSDSMSYSIDERAKIVHLKTLKVPFVNRMFSIAQLVYYIYRNRPDAVISFVDQVNILTAVAFLFIYGKTKLVLSERNDPYAEPNSPQQRKIRDWAYKKADGIVYQTAGEMEYFKDIISTTVPQTVIENPIKPGLPTCQGNLESKVFIAAGRLYPQKNYKMMIDAFQKVVTSGHSDYMLHIYGRGEMETELNQYIKDKHMEENIYIKGFSNNIHNIMAKSAGYLLSSDYEGISNSMIEALAIGVPVVTTDYPSGGASMYVVDGETGYLVKCGDTETFASSINSIIENRKEAYTMGAKASAILRKLDSETISNKWCDFIVKLL